MKKIWILFSIYNNYDQPDNNMVGWWQVKPSIEQLAGHLQVEMKRDETIAVIAKIWLGESMQFNSGDTTYRLEEVEEGLIQKS